MRNISEMTGTHGHDSARDPGQGRFTQLDGLRGWAAAVVVVFHFLAMIHPEFVPDFTDDPIAIADTPLGLLWNGPFAVFIFFVLSGFVIAGSASRRHDRLIANAIVRYLRLGIPVIASVLLAYVLLSMFPTATRDYAASVADPSPWLAHTVQGPLPSAWAALYDGAIGSFLTGSSMFNNVLWTMRIELVGSLMIFAIYWISGPKDRWLALCIGASALLIALFLRDAYLCFLTGALLYEAKRRNLLDRVPTWIAALALVIAIALGAPGTGFADRSGIEAVPWRLQPGNVWGLAPVVAATLLVFATLHLSSLGKALSLDVSRWLGRISFGLYLVHVPVLYTVVAWAIGTFDVPLSVIAAVYAGSVLLLAHLFTIAVDEPVLHLLSRLRRQFGVAGKGTSTRRSPNAWQSR